MGSHSEIEYRNFELKSRKKFYFVSKFGFLFDFVSNFCLIRSEIELKSKHSDISKSNTNNLKLNFQFYFTLFIFIKIFSKSIRIGEHFCFKYIKFGTKSIQNRIEIEEESIQIRKSIKSDHSFSRNLF